MKSASGNRGQSLVETALVLPAFAFTVWSLAQLAFFCLNSVEHQRMAQVAADQLTLNSYRARGDYTWLHAFYAPRVFKFTLPAVQRRIVATPEQKSFTGHATIDTGGRLIVAEVTSNQTPESFTGWRLRRAPVRASAETWLEPTAEEIE